MGRRLAGVVEKRGVMTLIPGWTMTASYLGALEMASALVGDRGAAILYSPERLSVVALEGEAWRHLDGTEAQSVPDVYEFRAFGDGREVRWLEDLAATGRLAAVGPGLGVVPATAADASFESIATIRAQAVLWGRVEKRQGSWAVLREHRVRELAVPVDAPEDGRVVLTSTEYVAVDEHGNAHVLDEILGGFERLEEERR